MRHANETTIHYADIQELHRLCYHGPGAGHTPREIIHGMSLLTPHQATVVTLILKGYSTTEIARATGHSIQWVKTNTIKAIQRLRNIHTHWKEALNTTMIQRNWLLGKCITDEELQGENRAEYGKE